MAAVRGVLIGARRMATNKRRDASFLIGRMAPDARLDAVKAADRVYDGLPILGRCNAKQEPSYSEVHTHGPAWSAVVKDGKLSYSKLQNPGKRKTYAMTPNWYNTVRTDTTDYVQRKANSLSKIKPQY